MPFAAGSVACVIYRVIDPLPDDFAQQAVKALERYAFRPIKADRGEDRSDGWVDPFNPLSNRMSLERLMLTDYFYLGFRIDRISPNRTVLNGRVRQAIEERLSKGERKRLSADERKTILTEQRNKLLIETSPSTVVHEVLWNTEAGWLFFSSQSAAANNEFLDLFADSFGLEITPMLPYTYAERWADNQGLLDALDSIEEGRFHKSGAAMAAAIATGGKEAR